MIRELFKSYVCGFFNPANFSLPFLRQGNKEAIKVPLERDFKNKIKKKTVDKRSNKK